MGTGLLQQAFRYFGDHQIGPEYRPIEDRSQDQEWASKTARLSPPVSFSVCLCHYRVQDSRRTVLYPVSYHHHFDRPSGPDYADSYSVRLSLSMLAAATYQIEGADFSNKSLGQHLDADRKSKGRV